MGLNVVEKILQAHDLNISHGEIPVIPDQVLTQDATGTMVYLQLEAIDIDRAKPFVVSYIDHNILQVGYKNHDDHRYLQGIAQNLGICLSKAGNGICHQLHLENFAKPGQILLGADSHTPTAGGAGMLAIGAGGLDVAVAIAGEPYFVMAPKLVGVRLSGRLPDWSSAKDVILSLLKQVTVKGGIGKIFEYFGPGVETLSVYERATICNMGAEMGVTSSIFPSDQVTYAFLEGIGRAGDWRELQADPDAQYDEIIDLDLSQIVPLVALPHSPDNVVKVSDVEGTPLSQVAIGSCTNSSYKDMATAASILHGKSVAEGTSLVVSPGSRRILSMMIETGVLKDLVESGARILEVACGPCNGIGQAPASGTNSLRTYNRNYKGRSGTLDANVFLASPETAAASALFGVITDPRRLGNYPRIELPQVFPVNNNLFVSPKDAAEGPVEIVKGPNIKPVPVGIALSDDLALTVELKAANNVTTDDIIPGGAEMLSLRSNIPALVPYTFSRIDPNFKSKLDTLPAAWAVVAGENFGQGSSREHAVLVPMSIGMKMIVALSFARIYRQNLINNGVVPLTFENPADYGLISEADKLVVSNAVEQIKRGEVVVYNKTRDFTFSARCDLSERETSVLLSGGLLNYVKNKSQTE